MRVLHSWVREFVPALDEHPVGADPIALGDRMSEIGLCCEEVELLGQGLDGIVVARVLELAPHPDADRIQLVQVDAGDGEPLQICCGAFNMSVGDLVPLAQLGATMPDGMEIARRKMRGEWSNGMLCSSSELGVSGDAAGILLLDGGLELGTPITVALGIEADAVYDLDLTPNRPDALSIIGVARDVAAALGLEFSVPTIDLAESGADASQLVSVEIADATLCGHFHARVISGVTVGESPAWIQRRLTLLGMRPINSVVDASNIVMLEYGQPSHTYDLAAVKGGHLATRRARDGETIETLDGQTRTLVATDGVIVDADDTVIGIAGVMGGASTEISASTTDVALELAWWDPPTVGATSKRLGLRSEASARYEKGVDTQIAAQAAARFAQLLVEQGATLHPGTVIAMGQLPSAAIVTVRPERVNAVLGSALSSSEMTAYLELLGFACSPDGAALRVDIPSWRPDSTGEIDVVEEIARLHGYANLGKTVPSSPRAGGLSARQIDIRRIRRLLVASGCSEVMPMPFLAPGDLEQCGVRSDGVVVANPLVADESILRTSLLPGLVKTVGYNAAHRIAGVSMFELGRCFAQPTVADAMPSEWEELAVVVAGREAAVAVELVHEICDLLRVGTPRIRNAAVGGLHPGRSATVELGGRVVGSVGEIDPATLEAHGVVERVAFLSLVIGGDEAWHGSAGILSVAPREAVFEPISRYPSSDIDLAFVVPAAVAADDVCDTIRESGGELVVAAALFDVYRGEHLTGDARSLAYRLRLQATDRTLTDADVAAVRQWVIDAVVAAHAATLRG